MNYSISQIATITGADYKNLIDANISVLLTDSRSLCFPDVSLFFALVTKKNNGHKYIASLYKKGVRNFMVSEMKKEFGNLKDANFLIVKDTLKALQILARHHRSIFSIPVIGITGSNGKTIVKEWLYQLLHDTKDVVRSPRSYNSQIGVPLSVWQMSEKNDIAIFEAGISKPDEMDRLADIICPTIGVLTNIGEPHQENFVSFKEKLDEKLHLFKKCDLIIYNGDKPELSSGIEEACLSTREISWSKKDRTRPLYISKIDKKQGHTEITYIFLGFEGKFQIPFTDEVAIENALHCLAVMLCLNINTKQIADKMKKLEPVAMRLEVIEGKNDCLLINDSYNSDINSLEIALDFQQRRSSKGITNTIILSDILQTGLTPKSLYRKVAELCRRKGVEKFIGIGRDLMLVHDLFPEGSEFYPNTIAFIESGNLDRFNKELILIKGARLFHFEEITERLELKHHETILEVNLDALIHNFNAYKAKLTGKTKIICMVKAFGYGAGSYELAKTLQDQGCDYLAVAVADEGAELRKQGLTIPIIVMNPEFSTLRTLFDKQLEPEVYSFKLLNEIIKEGERQGITGYPIHIKIDTGMHRLGFMPEQIDELISILSNQRTVLVKSIFSHLAGADDPQFDDFTRSQIDIFHKCASRIEKTTPNKVLKHILNSAGIERFAEKEQLDMVRLGIGLYGIEASAEDMHLRNVSSLKSTILQVKDLPKGDTVGYSRKGVLYRQSRIAMVPIGYADGYDRRLGNGNAQVVINGQKAPTIGNICMDICMIDVTDIKCEEGDEVTIFGEEVTVSDLAHTLDTIPYEIITSISSRVKRVYFRE